MKRHNRLVHTALLTAATCTFITACSSGSGGESDQPDAGQSSGEDGGAISLSITANSIAGGKGAAEAEWIQDWVIPEFEKAQAQAGKDVTVTFIPQGVGDEDYKTKIALDFESGKSADVVGLDGIWIGEFAEAGYIKPLKEVVGDAVSQWDGWEQIPEAVQNAASFNDELYGVPVGADGRVLYYNRELFAKAGLPEPWEPKSWDDVLDAARQLKKLDGITPIQLNAGTAMGEATTMQGFLPMLVGTGEQLWENGKWRGDTPGMRAVVNLYKTIYVDEELGDPILQQESAGRDNSFAEFAAGKIGILLEGDYLWRSVINPAEGVGTAPIENREEVVGYTLIPAMQPGKGVRSQDFVSMSGGVARVLNPASAHPEEAWELLTFMSSPEAFEVRAKGTLSISPRLDVNEKLLPNEPMLTYVSENVLPITSYRPGVAEYPEVSVAIQQLAEDVVAGVSIDDALATYVSTLEGIVGAEAVASAN